ncbi:MAG: hypothetical protein HYY24_28480 [Verrucomicrobia bacterium]|nr:hypothetical protein [Verrucomicrobiota bacterium]
MSSTTADIIQVCEALPEDQQAELADLAHSRPSLPLAKRSLHGASLRRKDGRRYEQQPLGSGAFR